jgi:hypothetical protein
MTPAQRQALRPRRKKLRRAFADAAAAITPGTARTWFVSYLAAVLKTYQELTTKSVDGKRLSKAVAKDPRTAFFRLLKSSKRDSKTRSRSAGALVHAHKSGVSPEELPNWLKMGGGVAGRAAELASTSGSKKQKADRSQDWTDDGSPSLASSEANGAAAEATDNSHEER